jgi:hypothetical protein
MGLQPQCASGDSRIDSGLVPPRRLVAAAVHLAVMPAAEGDRELIADLAAQRPRLRKLQVVGVDRYPTADQARELSNRFDMLAIADPPWRRQGQNAFVD